MKFKGIKLVGWGACHNHSFALIRLFDNLAPLGENKFVSELKRAHKFKRVVNRHTEDNSPKYRMVGNCYDKSSLRAYAKQSSETGATHVVHWNNSRKIAFTLAEVLVTLGIIGVVSAMTVPTLMQNYQRQSYVTQLHKTYNEMSQALLRYQTDKNAINLTEAGMTSQDAVNDFIKTYFKTVQECDTVNSCFASSYKTLSGETLPTYYFTMQNVKAYVLANGVSVRPGYNTDECAASNGVRIVAVAIDINGKKGPNIGGRDLFWMYFYNNGLIDDKPNDLVSNAPLTTEQREASFNKRCDTVSGSPDGCMGKIINDGWQMNY